MLQTVGIHLKQSLKLFAPPVATQCDCVEGCEAVARRIARHADEIQPVFKHTNGTCRDNHATMLPLPMQCVDVA